MDLELLDRTFPAGADLGTVRLLPKAEREAAVPGPLSPLLVPLAEGGENDLFALYAAPEAGARAHVVCAVDRPTGVWAPVTSSLQGFAAYLLLLRRAQAALPAHAGFDVRSVMAEKDAAAGKLARAFGLERLIAAQVEPDAAALADDLRRVDPSSPWACSLLARLEDSPAAALKVLAPALMAAPFSAGLLEQAAEAALAMGDEKRAARGLLAALSRLEPNAQSAPYRLDEPDEEGVSFAPLRVVHALRFLQSRPAALDREARATTPYHFLAQALGARPGDDLVLGAEPAVEASRRRMLQGDLPGARWILHLALAEHEGPTAERRALLEELGRAWGLVGAGPTSERCRAAAGAVRAAMEARGGVR